MSVDGCCEERLYLSVRRDAPRRHTTDATYSSSRGGGRKEGKREVKGENWGRSGRGRGRLRVGIICAGVEKTSRVEGDWRGCGVEMRNNVIRAMASI